VFERGARDFASEPRSADEALVGPRAEGRPLESGDRQPVADVRHAGFVRLEERAPVARRMADQLLRCALLNNGVDCASQHGWISAVHSDEDIVRSLKSYEKAFADMASDGAFQGM